MTIQCASREQSQRQSDKHSETAKRSWNEKYSFISFGREKQHPVYSWLLGLLFSENIILLHIAAAAADDDDIFC